MKTLSKVDLLLLNEPDPSFARRARLILTNIESRKHGALLDVGCGRGFYLKSLEVLCPNFVLTGIDTNSKYLKKARRVIKKKDTRVLKASVGKLPFKNNSFDVVLASEILEHVSNDENGISEISRVLKPGGFVLVSVPNKNYPFFWDPINYTLEKIFDFHIPKQIWWLAGMWADHERLYTKKEITNLLKTAYFRIDFVRLTTHYSIPFAHFLLYGLGKNLVEKGLFENFNRFVDSDGRRSVMNSIFLYPVRFVDSFNKKDKYGSSVNIVAKATKLK